MPLKNTQRVSAAILHRVAGRSELSAAGVMFFDIAIVVPEIPLL